MINGKYKEALTHLHNLLYSSFQCPHIDLSRHERERWYLVNVVKPFLENCGWPDKIDNNK